MAKRAQSDGGLVPRVIAYCEAKGIWAWRVNAGKIIKPGRCIVLAPPGTPDIFAVINGRLCGIECKAPKGKQRESQEEWERRANENGVGYLCSQDFADIVNQITNWQER